MNHWPGRRFPLFVRVRIIIVTSNPGFLTCGTLDIWGWIILVWGMVRLTWVLWDIEQHPWTSPLHEMSLVLPLPL